MTNLQKQIPQFKSFFKSTTIQSIVLMPLVNIGAALVLFVSQGGNGEFNIPPALVTAAGLLNVVLASYGINGRQKANPNLAFNPKKAQVEAIKKAQAEVDE